MKIEIFNMWTKYHTLLLTPSIALNLDDDELWIGWLGWSIVIFKEK